MAYIWKIYDSTKDIFTTSTFSTITGYKINMQNSVVFLFVNSELYEQEIKEVFQFTTVTNTEIVH